MQGLNSPCRKDGNAASPFSAQTSMWPSGTSSSLPSLSFSTRLDGLSACWVAWYFDGTLSSISADYSNIKIKWITILWIYLYLTRSERFFQSFPLVTGQKILTSVLDTQTMKGTFFSSSNVSFLTAQSDEMSLLCPLWHSLQYTAQGETKTAASSLGLDAGKKQFYTNPWEHRCALLVILGPPWVNPVPRSSKSSGGWLEASSTRWWRQWRLCLLVLCLGGTKP